MTTSFKGKEVKALANWLAILIHLAAWVIPGIYMWKLERRMFWYCLIVFGGLAFGTMASGSPLYPLFWAVYAFMGLFSTFQLKGWWFWTGLVAIPLSAWAVVQFIFTGTIFWF